MPASSRTLKVTNNKLPGHGLRQIREGLQLTLKDVEARSRQIADARQNSEYLFTAGRLSQVENSFSLPSLYKLASLSQIYQVPYGELLRLYGVETTNAPGHESGQGQETGEADSRGLTPSPLRA
jgi:transcriptional regulator with XRE-family HTH domain